MKKIITLDEYFNNTKYGLFFFDVEIKRSGITKEALLSDLEIPYMSYRRSREENTIVGKSIIAKLENYFSINSLDINRKEEYETVLNKIFNRFYYRGDNLEEFAPIIAEYIQENNILQPIFILFLLLINLVSPKSPQVIIEEQATVFNELYLFKKNYYISPFAELYVL